LFAPSFGKRRNQVTMGRESPQASDIGIPLPA
jgi:hypothetical protein